MAEDVAGAGALIVPSALLLEHLVCGYLERGPSPLTQRVYFSWARLRKLAAEARDESWAFGTLEPGPGGELRPGDEVPEASCAATAPVGVAQARVRLTGAGRDGTAKKAKLDVELMRIAGRWYFVSIDD